jgi:uncharacterized membrane protein YoaK (UPF0700 family)
MFRHQGKSRTYVHNLKLASLLSFVAGIVNITGVLSVKVLTTNVTGHFAFFSEDISNKQYEPAFFYLFFIVSFFAGAFISNFLIEIMSRKNTQRAFAFPMAVEIIILTGVALLGSGDILQTYGQLIACCLLFAMGLQNALVTKVSQSVVRTTHLTGLFTDLGIEVSQLFFYRKTQQFQMLSKSIYLKLAIIGCFFLGCVIGGLLYSSFKMETLLVAVAFLLFAFFYDNILLRYHHLKRKVKRW